MSSPCVFNSHNNRRAGERLLRFPCCAAERATDFEVYPVPADACCKRDDGAAGSLRGEPACEEIPRTLLSEGMYYTGQWLDCKPNGHGMMEFDFGGRYVGSWVDGEACGLGREVADGERYEGHFVNGVRHGEGACVFADGRRYVGQWATGRMDGAGEMSWADGMRYEGQYVNDKRSGSGVFVWPDGRAYRGGWCDGKQHGTGTFTDGDGLSWTGQWELGKRARGQVTREVTREVMSPKETRLPSSLGSQSTSASSEDGDSRL